MSSFLQFVTFPFLTGLTCVLIAVHWLRNYRRWSLLSKIPGPRGWPVIGNITDLFQPGMTINESALRTFDNYAKVYYKQGLYKLDLGPSNPNVYLNRVSAVEPLIKSSINIRKSTGYNVFIPWLGSRSLVLANPNEWRQDRKLINSAFNVKVLENMFPMLNKHSKLLVKVLEGDGIVEDVLKRLSESTFHITCEVSLGISSGSFQSSQARRDFEDYHKNIAKVVELLVQKILNPLLNVSDYIYFELTSNGQKCKKAIIEVHQFTNRVISNRKEQLITKELNPNELTDPLINDNTSLIDMLLKFHLEDPKSMSLESLRGQMDTFIFAGHDTSSIALTFGLMLIANHESVQEKIREELDLVFGEDNERDVTVEDIRELNYLDCVVKEILRLYSPVPLLARYLVEDLNCDNYIIPKNTDVWINVRQLHRDPEQFSNPERFDPDRFLLENSSRRHPFAYIPFSSGIRNCIGHRFAMHEIKVIFAHVLRTVQLKPITKEKDIICTFETTLNSKEPIQVEFLKCDK